MPLAAWLRPALLAAEQYNLDTPELYLGHHNIVLAFLGVKEIVPIPIIYRKSLLKFHYF